MLERMKHGLKKAIGYKCNTLGMGHLLHWYLVIYTLKISSILQSLKILSSQQQMAKHVVSLSTTEVNLTV